MPIESGRYIITNVRQRNLVTLPDPNDGTPLAAGVRKNIPSEQWFVELHSNGTYSIRNILHEKSFANAEHRAESNATVEGRNYEQYWSIQQSRSVGRYTICTTDTRLFWALEDRELGTPITLLVSPTDQRCWWTFEDAESSAISQRRQRNHNSNSRVGTPDPVIAGRPTPNDAVILLDIPFKISESKGLLDPVTSVFEALQKVISAAKATFESDEEWKIPIRRLTFHLDTIKYQRVELEKDFKIDGIVPIPDTTIIEPLEKYAIYLRNVYQLIDDKGPVRSSISRAGDTEALNEETIGQSIIHMDFSFDKYTTALQIIAEQAYKDMQELPQVGHNLGVEAPKPYHIQSKRPNTHGVQHKECLAGTRQKTIKAIREWADDKSGSKPTFLLLDVAGSGKSTIAKTMSEELGRTRLIARYFFSRDTTATKSTEWFCSTVSATFLAIVTMLEAPMLKAAKAKAAQVKAAKKQIALLEAANLRTSELNASKLEVAKLEASILKDPKPKHEQLADLIKMFRGHPDFTHFSFAELFNGLVVDPLEALSIDAILIIDALDECNNEDDSCTDLLDAICSQRPSTPRLRILATGRPELHITRWAKQYNIEWHNFFRLEGTNKDVDLYIEQALQDLPDIHDTVKTLANGLFIWARIACDLIRKTADVNRLLRELGNAVNLDYLYKVALNQSIPKDEGSRRVFAVVLQMILASRSPLSIAELDKLAPEPRIVEQIVTRLGALLVYQNREDPIRLLHATFREFLTTRSKAEPYFIQIESGHHTLTLGCLNYINYQSTQKFSTPGGPDDITEREEAPFLTGYILTAYLEFTCTCQSRGCITVLLRIESWLWTPNFWNLSSPAYRYGLVEQTNGVAWELFLA